MRLLRHVTIKHFSGSLLAGPATATGLYNKKSCLSTTTSRTSERRVRVGCASGFWGDTPTAAPQLIRKGNVDYLVFDYLSELTMSLLTAAKQKKPELGFAPDFVMAGIGPYLKEIKEKGIKVITNAGGINTASCAAALKDACSKAGVELNIAQVTGDDLMPLRDELLSSNTAISMDKAGMHLPKSVHSMTAYFGAEPIVKALQMGADIIVTGRTADSALALAPLMHEFGWTAADYDQLAAGSLAGHLIECGGQATGGLYTDWDRVPGYEHLGFPVVEVEASGDFLVTKPPNTGGLLSSLSVSEQMLYEIGDPANYVLPDVNCDFSQVKMKNVSDGCVHVSGAIGKPATDTYKVCATFMDGYKANSVSLISGGQAAAKGRKVAAAIMNRSSAIFKKLNMQDFDRSYVSIIGAEDSFGKNALDSKALPREAAIWMSVQHRDKKALDIWAREIASAGTGMAPGLTMLVGGRPKPSPCLKLFSFLYPKSQLPATVQMGDQSAQYNFEASSSTSSFSELKPNPVVSSQGNLPSGECTYRLEELCVARSGDKGDSCNIGVIARKAAYLPFIKEHLSEALVRDYFAHFFPGGSEGNVTRFDVPGINAINFLLVDVLDGGGMASLRPDPLGKSFAQMLLDIKLEGLPSKEEMVAYRQ